MTTQEAFTVLGCFLPTHFDTRYRPCLFDAKYNHEKRMAYASDSRIAVRIADCDYPLERDTETTDEEVTIMRGIDKILDADENRNGHSVFVTIRQMTVATDFALNSAWGFERHQAKDEQRPPVYETAWEHALVEIELPDYGKSYFYRAGYLRSIADAMLLARENCTEQPTYSIVEKTSKMNSGMLVARRCAVQCALMPVFPDMTFDSGIRNSIVTFQRNGLVRFKHAGYGTSVTEETHID